MTIFTAARGTPTPNWLPGYGVLAPVPTPEVPPRRRSDRGRSDDHAAGVDRKHSALEMVTRDEEEEGAVVSRAEVFRFLRRGAEFTRAKDRRQTAIAPPPPLLHCTVSVSATLRDRLPRHAEGCRAAAAPAGKRWSSRPRRHRLLETDSASINVI